MAVASLRKYWTMCLLSQHTLSCMCMHTIAGIYNYLFSYSLILSICMSKMGLGTSFYNT